ncbi:hypothetical protein [Kribbella pittospori]|uniref:hypothetical protein n=1 Tax=Kribbella pittospori TaxID=722689 RepID=UPI001EDE2393|nr:hypothetical protein [Kribbella pittospori]
MVRPRTFELVRYRDPSGVSGTGVVAEGCEFSDGSVALRWCGDNPATAVWPNLHSVLAVHGHHGATEVRWIEAQPAARAHPAADIDHLFDELHEIRPPESVADPSPISHARGWAGARHLR